MFVVIYGRGLVAHQVGTESKMSENPANTLFSVLKTTSVQINPTVFSSCLKRHHEPEPGAVSSVCCRSSHRAATEPRGFCNRPKPVSTSFLGTGL